MAIISANEIWEGRGGSDDAQGGRTDTRTFLVITDSAYETSTTIKAAGVIPERRSTHPEDAGMWVVDRSFQQDSLDPRVWRVTVSYASVTPIRGALGSSGGSGGGGTNELQENPLLRRPEFSFSTDKYQEELDSDFSAAGGVYIRNSAKEPFFPPLSRPRGRLVMTYTKNVSPQTFVTNLEKYEETLGSINDDIFADFFYSYSLLYEDFQAQDGVENGVYFYRCVHRFLIRFETWITTRVVDQGFRELLASGEYREMRDLTGHGLTRPAYLDGSGLKLSPQTGTPVTKSFQLYPSTSFAFLE